MGRVRHHRLVELFVLGLQLAPSLARAGEDPVDAWPRCWHDPTWFNCILVDEDGLNGPRLAPVYQGYMAPDRSLGAMVVIRDEARTEAGSVLPPAGPSPGGPVHLRD